MQGRISAEIQAFCLGRKIESTSSAYKPGRDILLPSYPPERKHFNVTPDRALQLTGLLAFALGSNLPLGYLRETSRKFSVRWFVLIHLSIPFIIALRLMLDFGWSIIPLTLACAVAGQIIGARLRRRQL